MMDGWMDGWMDGCTYVCMYVVNIDMGKYVDICLVVASHFLIEIPLEVIFIDMTMVITAMSWNICRK